MLFLSDFHTRQLLAAIRTHTDIYRSRWRDDEDDHRLATFTLRKLTKGGVMEELHVTREQIRLELANRPHIPNKQERKLINQLKRQTGLSEEALRVHPVHGKKLFDAQQQRPRKEISKQEYEWMKRIYGIHDAPKKFVIKG